MEITVALAARTLEAVREVAADEVLPRFRSVVAERKDDGSLVTEADLAAQAALARRLGAIVGVAFLGEEMDAASQLAILERGGRFWCVDPIDGTANFSAGVPYFAVSVALMEGRRPVLGIVYDPIADEAFHAVRGAGAWLNGAALACPPPPAFAAAIAEVGLRRDLPALRHAIRDRRPFAQRRTSGSSALSWCHLAAGRIDLFVHAGQKAWDYAAGALVLEEAGGSACTLDQDDFWSAPGWDRSVIAARAPALFAPWRDWVRAHRGQ